MSKQVLRQRIEWLDMAKGYGILLVILAHLDQATVQGWWIYTFHMPLFFFLSGCVFSKPDNFKIFLLKKCKSILLPYFTLGIPMVIFEMVGWYMKGAKAPALIKIATDFLVQKRIWTLWFLAVLLGVNILFYVVLKIAKKDWQVGIITLLLTVIGLVYFRLGGGALPWNIDTCFTSIPFFCAGYFYKKIDGEKFYIARSKWITFWLLLFVNIVAAVGTYAIAGTGLEMFYCKYGFEPLTYLSAFAGIFCVIIISKVKVFAPIRYIGENSIVYFAWHQTIFIPIVRGLLAVFGYSISASSTLFAQTIYHLVCLGVIVILITLCNMGIMKTRLRKLIGR